MYRLEETSGRDLSKVGVSPKRFFYDPGGVFNRHFLRKVIEEQALDLSFGFGIIMCDLDYFKKINDTLGHDIGDDALKCLGEEAVRITDKYSCDKVKFNYFRNGGDEGIILVNGEEIPQIRERYLGIAEEMNQIIYQTPYEVEGNILKLQLSSSLGVASYRDQKNFIKTFNEPEFHALFDFALANRASEIKKSKLSIKGRDKKSLIIQIEALDNYTLTNSDSEIFEEFDLSATHIEHLVSQVVSIEYDNILPLINPELTTIDSKTDLDQILDEFTNEQVPGGILNSIINGQTNNNLSLSDLCTIYMKDLADSRLARTKRLGRKGITFSNYDIALHGRKSEKFYYPTRDQIDKALAREVVDDRYT